MYLQAGHLPRLFGSSAGIVRGAPQTSAAGVPPPKLSYHSGAGSEAVGANGGSAVHGLANGGSNHGSSCWAGGSGHGYPAHGHSASLSNVDAFEDGFNSLGRAPAPGEAWPPLPGTSGSGSLHAARTPRASREGHERPVAAPVAATEVAEPPVAMSRDFIIALRGRVRWCTVGLVLTAGLLSAVEWYWVAAGRMQPHVQGTSSGGSGGASATHSITKGSDGALWILGVSAPGRLDPAQYFGWGLVSVLSTVHIAGSYWAPLCCAASLLDAHVQLATQLHKAVAETHPADQASAAAFVMSVAPRHALLAQETAARLGWYTTAHLLAFGYAALSGVLHLALDGVSAAVTAAVVVSVGALCSLLHSFGASNARFRDQLMLAANSLVSKQVHHDFAAPVAGATALAAHAVVLGELRSSRARLGVCGVVDVSPKASIIVLLVGAALLAVAIQVGLQVDGGSA